MPIRIFRNLKGLWRSFNHFFSFPKLIIYAFVIVTFEIVSLDISENIVGVVAKGGGSHIIT